MITDMDTNKMSSPVATQLFMSGRNLKFHLFFKVPKDIGLNVTDTLFYHENTRQRRTPTNSIKSFI